MIMSGNTVVPLTTTSVLIAWDPYPKVDKRNIALGNIFNSTTQRSFMINETLNELLAKCFRKLWFLRSLSNFRVKRKAFVLNVQKPHSEEKEKKSAARIL